MARVTKTGACDGAPTSDQHSEQRATTGTLDVISDEHHICVALAPVLS